MSEKLGHSTRKRYSILEVTEHSELEGQQGNIIAMTHTPTKMYLEYFDTTIIIMNNTLYDCFLATVYTGIAMHTQPLQGMYLHYKNKIT